MSAEFAEPDVQENARKRALVLIQGTGDVRAGIWARSVCINEDLGRGSMLPFVEKCKEQGIPLLVMNPNYNEDPTTGQQIPHNEDMEAHALWMWQHYVVNSGFTDVSVVAHSAGGHCLSSIM